MTIPAGYLDQDGLPAEDTGGPFPVLFPCTPRAGLWIGSAVGGADATDKGFPYEEYVGQEMASLSFGAIDAQGDSCLLWEGSSTQSGFTSASSYVEPGGGIVNHPLTAITWSLSNKGVGELLVNMGLAPGWEMAQGTTYPDAGTRGFFLALQGDSMESERGTFVTPGDGSGNSISTPTLTGDPDLVIVFGIDQGSGGGAFSVGAVDADGNQFAAGHSATHITFIGPSQRYRFKSDAVLYIPVLNGFGGGLGMELTATIVPGGFDVTDVFGGAALVGYIAIRDPNGEFHVGSGEAGDSFAGAADRPEAVFFASTWASDESDHEHGGLSMGYVATPWSEQPSASGDVAVFAETDATTDERWRTNRSGSSLVQTQEDGTVVDNLDAAITSDGFTTSSPSTKLFGFITMKGSFQTGCQARNRRQIYRLVLP